MSRSNMAGKNCRRIQPRSNGFPAQPNLREASSKIVVLRPSFTIIEATKYFSNVPGGLPALVAGERDTLGATISLCAVGDIGLSGRAARTAQRSTPGVLFADV